MTVLDIENLCKKYESFRLGPIDMQLEEGTAYGLIGPNGAGKSTLFRCIIGTVRRNQGVIRINGSIADSGNGQWKQSIGYIGDYTPLFERWSGTRNLREFSKYYENWSDKDALAMASRLDLDLSGIRNGKAALPR